LILNLVSQWFIDREKFWAEQLLAESTGKTGVGIIPIDLEPQQEVQCFSRDRIFFYLSANGERRQEVAALLNANFPVITFNLSNFYDIAACFYLWEIATAVACALLGVNAFDQPDVQDNKNRTKKKISEYSVSGKFSQGKPAFENEIAKIFSNQNDINIAGNNLKEIIKRFLKLRNGGDYIAINAYLPRTQKIENNLQEFRKFVLTQTSQATTLGFGPRFLHSSGQLHKGGPNIGLFIQIVDRSDQDIEIPGWDLTFGTLLYAQALGDYEALVNRNRRIIRIELKQSNVEEIWK